MPINNFSNISNIQIQFLGRSSQVAFLGDFMDFKFQNFFQVTSCRGETLEQRVTENFTVERFRLFNKVVIQLTTEMLLEFTLRPLKLCTCGVPLYPTLLIN